MNKSGVSSQVISHPQGGAAIQGLGERFAPDLHTGTGNLTVPIALPEGRAGLTPELALSYSTGQGNGPFGLGWALNLPGVFRDTSKGVPTYAESDVFVLSGAEPLVAIGAGTDGWQLYRPRTEGAFARIRRRRADGEDFWEAETRDGLRSRYGAPRGLTGDLGVVRNPHNSSQIFAWRLMETTDPFGNCVEYLYERDRSEVAPRWDQLRLKTIRYGDYGSRETPRFLVSVEFVYALRPDPVSNRRAGFEVRDTRRCSSIEVRTHADTDRLTRVYRLTYLDELEPEVTLSNGASLLARIEVEGVDGLARELLPALDLGYSRFNPSGRRYHALGAGTLPERSLAHPDFELADLFGRGLPDIVQIGEAQRYWRNLGEGQFDSPRPLEVLPPSVRLGDATATLADIDGDGHIDLVIADGRRSGYAPLVIDAWDETRPFVPINRAPPFLFADPEVRLVDLDGDGSIDALRTGASFELFYHHGAAGWTEAETRTRGSYDRFPDVRFSDPRVKLADMTGDGLQDIVFVGLGHVDYWPYRGYGRWDERHGRAAVVPRRLPLHHRLRPEAPAPGRRGWGWPRRFGLC
jgi:Salmonella virulence plasmid 65kDa B protein/FG-GAP-like repeat